MNLKVGQFDARLCLLLSPTLLESVIDKTTKMQVLLRKIQFQDMAGMILQKLLASKSEAFFFLLILNLDSNLWG